MRKSLSLILFACVALCTQAQVTTRPAIVQKGYKGEITIVFNPNEGNQGMKGATQCYAHTGITYNGSSWQKTGTWRDGKDKYKMTQNADGNWELKIAPDIYTYYGVAESTEITQICLVFNDGPGGSKEGKTAAGGDIFVDLAEAGFAAQLIAPTEGQLFEQNQIVTMEAQSTQEADLVLTLDGEQVAHKTNATAIVFEKSFSEAGTHQLRMIATSSDSTIYDSVRVCVVRPTEVKKRPEGIRMGINYDPMDATKVTLCMLAGHNKNANDNSVLVPEQSVFVLGDFNNWEIDDRYQMWRDSIFFWVEIENLIPGQEYAYQYLVKRTDNRLVQLGDIYAEKTLCKDDQYEPRKLNPDLMPYPKKGDGYVAVLQTGKPAFPWSEATLSFKRPDKNNLVIYEVWVYDYTKERSIEGLQARLDYLETLGINAIELMPICEFDGNYNWGYSPNHYFAPDKAYGTETMYKTFIDECHKRGIAVILDMVFNHGTGNSPAEKLYPYGDDLKWNPWFNVTAPHGDNVYEDWNHDFAPAREMFSRSLQYWLTEYKVDGFRMDLSHGFCGKNCSSLHNNILYYQQAIRDVSEDAYFIQEYWGSNPSAQTLVNEGMMCWTGAGLSNAYCQLAMGYLSNSSLSDGNRKGYVSYCESHDEERNYYKARTWGAGDLQTNSDARLGRISLTLAFNILLNGPHMIWQYNELGYDYSINMNEQGQEGDYRCDKKPRPDAMGWFSHSARMGQYARVAKLTQLRTKIWPEVFAGTPTVKLTDWLRTIHWKQDDKQIFVAGNFSVDTPYAVTAPEGLWFDYFTGLPLAYNNMTLAPGELRLLVNDLVVAPMVDIRPFADYNTGSGEPGRADLQQIVVQQKNNKKATKHMLDGRLIIVRDGAAYSIMGQPLTSKH